MQSEERKDYRSGRRANAVTPDIPCSIFRNYVRAFRCWGEDGICSERLGVSILVPIYNREGLIAVPASNRPLGFILILRKIFGKGKTVKIVE